MASSYTSRIRLEKQADGENPNSWGLILNQNVIDMIDDAVAGYEIVSVSSANVTLTTNNGTADQSRNATIEFAGALTGNVTITIPSQEKVYFFRNNTTGGFSVFVKTAGGSSLGLIQEANTVVACDGTEIYRISTDLLTDTSPELGGDLGTNGFNIKFPDSTGVSANRLTFGDARDLSVYHDSSNSYIVDSGTGNITIGTNQLNILNAALNENMAQFNADGTSFLNFDGTIRLATTSIGVSVAGNLEVAGTSATGQIVASFIQVSADPQIYVGDAASVDNAVILGYDRADNAGYLTVAGDADTTLRVNNGGTVSMSGAVSIAGVLTAGATESQSANGYVKLPSGIYIQWGTNTASTGGGSTHSFPVTFPSNAWVITGSPNNDTTGVEIKVVSTSQFKLTSAGGTPSINWIAIGN